MSTPSVREVKKAIEYHAKQCETSLQCADFADVNSQHYSAGTSDGLRQLASYSSEQAFSWARHLRVEGGAA